MFKVGDKVKCINDEDNNYSDVHPGKIYIIQEIFTNGISLTLKDENGEFCGRNYNGEGRHFQYPSRKFILKLEKETDYLDAFQRNFKEGV
jgi:hypothetical protein